MLLPSTLQFAVAAASGVSSHVLYFKHGEHHMQAPAIILFYSCVSMCLALFEVFAKHENAKAAIAFAGILVGTHAVTLFTSMVTYRLFFHPLRNFPGPLDMRISKLAHVFRLLKLGSKNYELLEDLRLRYGDFSRTGPNELTIFHPDVLTLATRPGNEMQRSDWYDLLQPSEPMATTRNRPDHDARKKIFDRAFSRNALNEYNAYIVEHVRKLDARIAASAGRAVEVGELFLWMSFDIMGEFAFGRSFNMLENNEWHYAADLLRSFMALLGPLSPVPWLCRIGMNLPVISDPWWKFKRWCIGRCHDRLKVSLAHTSLQSFHTKKCVGTNELQEEKGGDIFSWLMNSPELTISQEKIEGDAIAIIIAGSDTSASVLLFIFYFLASRPSLQEVMRDELASVEDIWNSEQLEKLPFMNATISESLRLYPPIPSSGLRTTGPSGLTVGGTFIPPGVTICMPTYSLGRLEQCYKRPHEFMPERWLEKDHEGKNRTVQLAYSKGRFSCPGKMIAQRELRLVLASLVSRYDVTFAPGEDGQKMFQDLTDEFVFAPGKLYLRFTPRVSQEVAEDWV